MFSLTLSGWPPNYPITCVPTSPLRQPTLLSPTWISPSAPLPPKPPGHVLHSSNKNLWFTFDFLSPLQSSHLQRNSQFLSFQKCSLCPSRSSVLFWLIQVLTMRHEYHSGTWVSTTTFQVVSGWIMFFYWDSDIIIIVKGVRKITVKWNPSFHMKLKMLLFSPI